MCARRETRMMPICQRAQIGMSCQICLQPLFLRRTVRTATHLVTIRVQDNDVPGTDFITIVTFGWIASRGTKIIVVTTGASHQIFMVASGRMDNTLGSSPTGVKGLLILCE